MGTGPREWLFGGASKVSVLIKSSDTASKLNNSVPSNGSNDAGTGCFAYFVHSNVNAHEELCTSSSSPFFLLIRDIGQKCCPLTGMRNQGMLGCDSSDHVGLFLIDFCLWGNWPRLSFLASSAAPATVSGSCFACLLLTVVSDYPQQAPRC